MIMIFDKENYNNKDDNSILMMILTIMLIMITIEIK